MEYPKTQRSICTIIANTIPFSGVGFIAAVDDKKIKMTA
jgi:hypothetical protein